MEVTFTVSINLDDTANLPEYAGDIADDLTSAGYDVIEVKPWARPVTAPQVNPFGAQSPNVP